MKLLVAFIGLAALLTGCSASTGSRYETKADTETENTIEEKKEVVEDFDITPYATEIDIEAPPIATGKVPSDVWYEYNLSATDSMKNIIGTTDGYRVQVLSTDDIDEANIVRAEIYEQTSRKEVYIIFEPPFYKIKIGDFTSKSEAENLRFKLNQLGYTESKVVQETVNIFE
ncbi:MAG TPA: SPOR domain-containing protein [Ignavibacteriaceae bacterium]